MNKSCGPFDVVVMSFGTFCTDDDPGLLGDLAPALLGDAVGVAAAGNLQTSRPYFPAALPGVIGVGGLDRGGPAWFTNFGSWVDACAPAVNVVSTFFNDVTETIDGQSPTPLPGVGAVERDELRRTEGRRGDRPGDVREPGSADEAWRRLSSTSHLRLPDLGVVGQPLTAATRPLQPVLAPEEQVQEAGHHQHDERRGDRRPTSRPEPG